MDFESFFRATHGQNPFPWQSEVARRFLNGDPPGAINLPTASGKTAMIDAAVYWAAYGGPSRIAFIIDRRVVVDEAYNRALRISEGLMEGRAPEIEKRLGPIQVVRLRGGVHGDDDWVLYPERLTILISTVDQIGSRLLHRGYGVSSRMAPLHAGFVGNNALYIVDEAHISLPFIETVRASVKCGAGVRMITMSATLSDQDSDRMELTDLDRSNTTLACRFRAEKKAELLKASGKEAEFVRVVADAAEDLSKSSDAVVVGVVVNRVGTARAVQHFLVNRKHPAVLLTGRIRPYDRDRLLKSFLPEIRAGRVRKESEPLFVVATQTIEVGADVDFDSLVTEAAPLDSLRQRFGRLDRLGELGISKAVIVYREPKLDEDNNPSPDPVYGSSIHSTWQWLVDTAEEGAIDFGIYAMENTLSGKEEPPAHESKHVATILPSHFRLLAQTGPEAPEIDITPWLHGTGNKSPDVSLIWRRDLEPENGSLWSDTVRMRPPLTREALEIPIYTARAWLEGRRPQDVTDQEGSEYQPAAQGNSAMPVLRWRGPDECEVVYSQDIRPGDTLIMPAVYGGCDEFGWNPAKKTEVQDIADMCSLERGRNHIVRLVPGLMSWLGIFEDRVKGAINDIIAAETEVNPEEGVDEERIRESHSIFRSVLSEVQHPLLEPFSDGFEIDLLPKGLILRNKVPEDFDATLYSGVPVELERHLQGVVKKTREIATDHPHKSDICKAARLHDIGKKEPRFQIMLYGDAIEAAAGPLLAKSGLKRFSDRVAAYWNSGLPRGYRHEIGSFGYIDEENKLVRYLIATHHGYGRPWFPACSDIGAPGVEITVLGSDWLKGFVELLDEYGPWALAEMELLMRAADARQSAAERAANDV